MLGRLSKSLSDGRNGTHVLQTYTFDRTDRALSRLVIIKEGVLIPRKREAFSGFQQVKQARFFRCVTRSCSYSHRKLQ